LFKLGITAMDSYSCMDKRVLMLNRLAFNKASNTILHTINRIEGYVLNTTLTKTTCGETVRMLKPYRKLNSNYCFTGLISFKISKLGVDMKPIPNAEALPLRRGSLHGGIC